MNLMMMMIYHESDDDDDDFATIDYQMVIHDESDDSDDLILSDSGIILVLLDSGHFMGIFMTCFCSMEM